MKGLIKVIKDKVKYRLVWQSVSDGLEQLGITIVPYYTFDEHFANKLSQGLNLESDLKPLEPGFLTYPEIEAICHGPEGAELEMDREKLRGDDCRCFALKHNGEVLSYMLCNFKECDSRLETFPLEHGEVYLTGAYTFTAYRGHNLVTVLEYELYKQLDAMGLRKYHSINVLYNTPSLKFKEKLKSKPSARRLFIKLFNRFQWNMTLKQYHRPTVPAALRRTLQHTV